MYECINTHATHSNGGKIIKFSSFISAAAGHILSLRYKCRPVFLIMKSSRQRQNPISLHSSFFLLTSAVNSAANDVTLYGTSSLMAVLLR